MTRKKEQKRKRKGCQEKQDKTPGLPKRAASARATINEEASPRYAPRQVLLLRRYKRKEECEHKKKIRSPRTGVKLMGGWMICG